MEMENQLTNFKEVEPWERFLILAGLDGTLLNNKGQLTARTKKVIKEITDAGHVFVIISGYTPVNTLKYYKQLGLKNLMCNLNGAYIWNPSDKGFVPVNLCFNWEVCVKILTSKRIMKYVKNFVIENYKGTYIKRIPKNKKDLKKLLKRFHLHKDQELTLCDKSFKNLKGVDCHSILLQVKEESKETLNMLIYELHRFSKKLNSHVWRDEKGVYFVEISTKFSTKGTALSYLSNYYSIPLEQCIAFGDSDNDAEMLRTAIYSFAMANGTVPAKLSAHYITKFTNDEDGVARTLEYLDRTFSRTSYAAKKKILAEVKEIARLRKDYYEKIYLWTKRHLCLWNWNLFRRWYC